MSLWHFSEHTFDIPFTLTTWNENEKKYALNFIIYYKLRRDINKFIF